MKPRDRLIVYLYVLFCSSELAISPPDSITLELDFYRLANPRFMTHSTSKGSLGEPLLSTEPYDFLVEQFIVERNSVINCD